MVRNTCFLSPRSLKTREKYTNWDNIVCLSLYIFWAHSHLCLLLQKKVFCKSKHRWLCAQKICKLRHSKLSQFVYFSLVLREREETKNQILRTYENAPNNLLWSQQFFCRKEKFLLGQLLGSILYRVEGVCWVLLRIRKKVACKIPLIVFFSLWKIVKKIACV